MEAQALHRRQSQPQLHHVGRKRPQVRNPARQRLDLDIRDAGNDTRPHGEVRVRARLAQQNVTALRFFRRDAERWAVG